MQVSEEEVQAAMPDRVYPRWVVGSYACIGALGGILGYSLLFGNPTGRFITATVFTSGIAWICMTLLLAWGSNRSIYDYRNIARINNDIGFQRIWMLGPDDTLDSRLERRDHQNAQHNTSEYCIYEQLGGPDAHTFIGRKIGAEYISEVDWVTLQPYGGGMRVRGKNVKYDDTTTIHALLRVLNATRGDLGFNACMTLASTQTLLKHALCEAEKARDGATAEAKRSAEELAAAERSLDELRHKYDGMLSDALALKEHATGVEALLLGVRKFCEKRSTRLSDLAAFIDENYLQYTDAPEPKRESSHAA